MCRRRTGLLNGERCHDRNSREKKKKSHIKKILQVDQRPTTRSTHKKSKLKKSHFENIPSRPKTKD
jgi:hypothetical protein